MKTQMKIKILLIEDNPGDVRLVQESLLESKSANIEWAIEENLRGAIEQIKTNKFDIALIDLSLPDSQGMNTFTQFRNIAQHLPIVILTGTDDEELALEAVQKGAQDYLVKGLTPGDLLLRAIRYAIERHQLQLKLKDAQDKLVEAERLRVLIETAGAAAHEINQPLTAIFGHLELVLVSDPQSAYREDLEFVRDAAKRIQDIVKSMGDIEQYQTKHYIGDMNIVDFNASASTTNNVDRNQEKHHNERT